MKSKIKLCATIFFSLSSTLYSTAGHSFELSTKLSGVEETDDVLKPSVGIELKLGSSFGAGYSYWGRSFGPVTESRALYSAYYIFKPFSTKIVSAAVGGSVLNEITELSYQPGYEAYNVKDEEFNAGMFAGIFFRIAEGKTFYFDAHWESSIFPAGTSGILLVTGRKQVLGLNLGVKL